MRRRTFLAVLALGLSLAGCSKPQPDFDERYESVSATIGKTAEDIEAHIAPSDEPQDKASAAGL